MQLSTRILTAEYQTNLHNQHEADTEARNRRNLTDEIRNNSLILKPEGDPENLNDYEKLPNQTSLNTCSHGFVYDYGVNSNMPYHDDESGDWILCNDDFEYEQFVKQGHPIHMPLIPSEA